MNTNCDANWCNFFKAVHDQHRQYILQLLKKHQTLNASQIISKLKLSQPTVSHHLKILHQAGLITTKKNGKEVNYSINQQQISSCCGGFMKHFC